jgi:GNAT superfamily N-acetyltransferase
MSPSEYRIRAARPDEIALLKEIENKAGEMFSGLGLIEDESLDTGVPNEFVRQSIELGQAWVICSDGDTPIGFVLVLALDGNIHVEEIDVLPEFGRRGLGAQLIEHVCEWAAAKGYKAVTLSTFRDIPWNGPFYRKHGFRDLTEVEWTPGMHEFRRNEVRQGLLVSARVFMRRELGVSK